MTSPRERLRRVLELAPDERVTLALAWALFPVADLALRVLPFTRLRTFSGRLRSRRAGARLPAHGPSIARVAWLVDVAGRHAPVEATCLKRALVLAWLLRRRGMATDLRIGVARHDGVLSAHAWLERDGEAIPELPGRDGHEPLLSPGAAARVTG